MNETMGLRILLIVLPLLCLVGCDNKPDAAKTATEEYRDSFRADPNKMPESMKRANEKAAQEAAAKAQNR